MPMQSVILRPGVNVERTPSLNEAGISQSQWMRFKDGLIQTIGGISSTPTGLSPGTGIVRDIHVWTDPEGDAIVSMAATSSLGISLVIQEGSSAIAALPVTLTSCVAVSLSITSGSCIVTVTDPNSGANTGDAVFLNTPISIGNLLLNNGYPINSVISTGQYTIAANTIASTTLSSVGTLPVFTSTVSLSPLVTVTLANHGVVSPLQGFRFGADTTYGTTTIFGIYDVYAVLDSTRFQIRLANLPSTVGPVTMNATLAQYVYYRAGVSSIGGPLGSDISSAANWSQDNWGEILLVCPSDGPIYTFTPNTGVKNVSPVGSAPFFNGGIFTSQPAQILVAWRSVEATGAQKQLVVRWSDSGDYTNWNVTSTTQAGSFIIPSGSRIMGGLQASNYGVIWTDIECWVMQYVAGDVIFNFTKIGSGCGLIGPHAAGIIRGEVYWCSNKNFFVIGPGGVEIVSCSVWDYIFQNINQTYASKIVCAPNSLFNEVAWFFPSAASTGENDSYVKYNILEKTWDYGSIPISAWTDVNPFGNNAPLANYTPTTTIYQMEGGDNPLPSPGPFVTTVPSFQTGWWSIADGNELAFVDWVLPDMKWSQYSQNSSASLKINFQSANYPGDTPLTYGPYYITSSQQYVTPRIRGRLMSMSISALSSLGTAKNVFWRIGRVRYRYAPAGRR